MHNYLGTAGVATPEATPRGFLIQRDTGLQQILLQMCRLTTPFYSCSLEANNGHEIQFISFTWDFYSMPTHNSRLLLLLVLVMRIVLATVCCRFGSWGLVINLNFWSDFEHFGQDFEVEVRARFWSWGLVSILLMMFNCGYKVESWSRIGN